MLSATNSAHPLKSCLFRPGDQEQAQPALFSRLHSRAQIMTASRRSQVYLKPPSLPEAPSPTPCTRIRSLLRLLSAPDARFNALARRRVGGEPERAFFNEHLLGKLSRELLDTVWMNERFGPDGLQQLDRTSHYFEYPAVTALMVGPYPPLNHAHHTRQRKKRATINQTFIPLCCVAPKSSGRKGRYCRRCGTACWVRI